MLDLNLVNGRYFDVKVDKYTLKLEPCSLKTIRRFQKLENNANDDLVSIVEEVLNKNKTNFKVPIKVIEKMTIDQMNELLLEYFSWIAKEKLNNPN